MPGARPRARENYPLFSDFSRDMYSLIRNKCQVTKIRARGHLFFIRRIASAEYGGRFFDVTFPDDFAVNFLMEI